MSNIHSTAIVAPEARLGEGVEVGPYSIIGPHVSIGAGTRVMAHVFLDGHLTIGSSCTIYPFASLGTQTQDLKFKGGTTRAEIGDRTTIREYVTVSTATSDGDVTRVGTDCHIMAYAHVAHDCVVGNGVIMANAATLAGHVIVEDQVTIGGLCGIHQFVRLGRLCITGGCSKVVKDIPPFMMADGNPIEIHGINSIGCERKGINEAGVKTLKAAYKILYRENLSVSQAVEKIEKEIEPLAEIQQLLAFIKSSERGITK